MPTHTPTKKNRLIYKIALFVITVALICYFIPRETRFAYKYDINKPWKYELLTAQFDFPIFKSDKQIQQEQDSILTLFEPYYVLDKEVQKVQLNKLQAHFNTDSIDATKKAYLHLIVEQLLQLYQIGIIASPEQNQKIPHEIMVVDRQIATPTLSASLLTVQEAYAQLMKNLQPTINAAALSTLNLHNFIVPNLHYNKEKSDQAKKELLARVPIAEGVVLTGQRIVDKGDLVSSKTYQILDSLQKESEKRIESDQERRLILIGQILFVSIFMLSFMLYLEYFRQPYFQKKRNILLLVSLMLFYIILTAAVVKGGTLSVYVIPYTILPLVIRLLLDSRTAFLTHLITILICSIMMRYPHIFILSQLVAGLFAIVSLRELSQRSQIFRTAFVVMLAYGLFYLAFELIELNDIDKIDTTLFLFFAINGALVLLTYPLLYLFERLFGFASNVTLVELSNTNNPLLRRLSEEASGTFQHSLQVANLASEGAIQIGANAQLVRTGALYHDIGKMENPAFFIENQTGFNPHKNINFEQSAHIIINHVRDGLKLAEKYNLPQEIKEFITSHHGKGKTAFFYNSFINMYPDTKINEEVFTYPGPNPMTRETALLMMADSVEATSRALPEYTEESIHDLVDRTINRQIEAGYFQNCPITFQDIERIKQVFKEKLKTIYHTRVSYPDLK